MSLWHADVDNSALSAGASLIVSSPHSVVRVVTSDQVSIQTTVGNRLSAQVLDRTGSNLTLVLPDGTITKLSMIDDDSVSDFREGEAFSQQRWLVN